MPDYPLGIAHVPEVPLGAAFTRPRGGRYGRPLWDGLNRGTRATHPAFCATARRPGGSVRTGVLQGCSTALRNARTSPRQGSSQLAFFRAGLPPSGTPVAPVLRMVARPALVVAANGVGCSDDDSEAAATTTTTVSGGPYRREHSGGDGGEDVEAGGPAGGADAGQETGDGAGDEHHGQLTDRDREAGGLDASRADQGPAEEHAEADAAERAEGGDQERLAPQHGADLTAGLAHGPEQPELPPSLVDRQRQGVGDPHEGDQDGQHQQHVDDAEQHVDGLG